MEASAEHPPLIAEIVRCKRPQEDHAHQAPDHTVHPKYAPQNAQRLQVSLHPREVHRHARLRIRRLRIRRLRHTDWCPDLCPALRTKMDTFRDWSSTRLTNHLTPPNTQGPRPCALSPTHQFHWQFPARVR